MNYPFPAEKSVKRRHSPVVRLWGCITLAALLGACSPQASEQELLDRAQLAMDQGNARAAVIDVKTALQQNPDNASARRLLGDIYIFQQDPTAAAEEYERALTVAGDNEVRVQYARALVAANLGDRLLELDQQDAFASVADDAQYLAALALAQAAAGERAQGRNTLDTALVEAPDDAYVATANAFFLMVYAGRIEEAQGALEQIVALHPDYAEAWSLLGSAQHLHGDLAEAEASYVRVAEINSYRLADRLNLINVRLAQGDMAEAETELQRLLASYPNNPGVKSLEGRLLLESGDNTEALAAFSEVFKVVPNHAATLYMAAVANIREGNLATALDQLNRFLVVQPDHLNGRLLLANLHLLRNNPDAAEEPARAVLAQDESNYAAMGLLAAALSAQQPEGQALANDESLELYRRMAEIRPEVAEPRLALGAALLQAGDTAGALEQLRIARDLDPESIPVREQLVRAQLASGDIAAARAEAEAFAEEYPQSPGPSLLLGHIALQEDDVAAARSHLERALQLDPGNVVANGGLAELASADQDLERAREYYLNALDYHPDHSASLLNLAAIEGARGNFNAMQSNLETAVQVDASALAPRLSLARLHLQQGRGAEAVRLLNEVRVDYPQEPAVWLVMTEALMATGDLASASDASERLLNLLPGDAIVLATAARVELRKGQFGAAESQLREALAVQPDNTDFQKLLIDALMGQGKIEEASTMLANLPEESGKEPAVLVAQGRIALATDNPAEAETRLRSAMDQEPNAMTLMWLSGAVAAQGRHSEATNLLNDWLVGHPDDVVVRNRLASIYMQRGDELEAREQYQRILQQVPDNVLVLNNLAWLLREDDPQMALAHIERANELAPNNPQVMDTYAMIQRERGAIPDALALNQEALQLMPDNPGILYHRALLLHEGGQAQQAIDILEQLASAQDVAVREQAQSTLVAWQAL